MRKNVSPLRKHKPGLSFARREALTGLFFVSVFILGLLWVYLPAIVNSVILSFSETDGDFNLSFVGWRNYHHVLRVDPDYVRNLASTLSGLLADVVVIILYSMFVCTLLNMSLPGRGMFRALLFLPVIVSTGCIETFMRYSVQSSGALSAGQDAAGLNAQSITNYVLSLSVSSELTGIISGAIGNIYGIITRSGVQIILFLAGLQSISPSIYEAARVEGCTAWESYWKITIPLLSPQITVCVVYTVVDSFTRTDNRLMKSILSYAMDQFNYGLSSAMAWGYFLIVSGVLAAIVALLSRFTFYETR